MSDARWRIRVNDSDLFKVDTNTWHVPSFVGEFGHIDTASGKVVPRYTIIGDSIAEVMDSIAFHEGEQP
jgi:hypothetical protein